MPVASVLFFVFGLLVGSFLNVCIYRLPRRESLNWPGSHCTSCDRPLSWYENIPLVSWLVLRGRCRTCHTPISPAYPIIEALTGLVFLAAFDLYALTPLLAVRLLFACSMIVLFVIDLQHRILPNVITVPGVVVGLAASLWLPPGWLSSSLGLLLGGGSLFLIGEVYYRTRGVEGMGMGDVKMLAMIGAFLGWKAVLVTLILSSFSGALVGIGLIALSRGGMRLALPFGTFLSLGALAAMLVGEPLVRWYSGFFVP